MYIEGDVPYVTNGTTGNGNGFWGGDGIWAILLLALLGNGGWGAGRGGFGGYAGSEFVGYELGKAATQADVASGFNNSAVLSSLNDIKLTQADEIIEMGEAVGTAIRKKKNSSIVLSVDAVAKGKLTVISYDSVINSSRKKYGIISEQGGIGGVCYKS